MSKSPALLNLPLPPFIDELFTPHCEFHPWHLLEQGSAAELAEIQALVIYGHPHIDDAVLDKLPNLKVISNFGVGVDHIDIAACSRHGVPVGNTPGAVTGATADMTMALLLAAARNIVIGDKFARTPGWTSFNPSDLPGKEVYGSTLGIIGFGRIGQEVAKRARAFDMQVLYFRRHRDPQAEQRLGVEYADLDTLLSHADYVTLNVPLTADTRHLIGASQLQRMRADAMLINVARGGVVDHDALYRALSEGWIAAAAVDVTEPEPLPRDHPLLQLDNIIIAPHLGSATVKTRAWMGRMMVENMVAGLNGEALPYHVKV
jgi:glyoxylate reductase